MKINSSLKNINCGKRTPFYCSNMTFQYRYAINCVNEIKAQNKKEKPLILGLADSKPKHESVSHEDHAVRLTKSIKGRNQYQKILR